MNPRLLAASVVSPLAAALIYGLACLVIEVLLIGSSAITERTIYVLGLFVGGAYLYGQIITLVIGLPVYVFVLGGTSGARSAMIIGFLLGAVPAWLLSSGFIVPGARWGGFITGEFFFAGVCGVCGVAAGLVFHAIARPAAPPRAPSPAAF